jgi:hypothetical protein
MARARKPAPKPKAKARRETPLQLNDEDRDLIRRLCERTALLPREVLERALAGYAAAVAPGMALRPVPVPKGKKGQPPSHKLFLSVDGKPEIAVEKSEFVLGSGEDTDLRLDLPLISPRHARILWKDGRHVFEDLRSARGSFQFGQPVDVRLIESGDEIDLGGFLPIRFRLAAEGL